MNEHINYRTLTKMIIINKYTNFDLLPLYLINILNQKIETYLEINIDIDSYYLRYSVQNSSNIIKYDNSLN